VTATGRVSFEQRGFFPISAIKARALRRFDRKERYWRDWDKSSATAQEAMRNKVQAGDGMTRRAMTGWYNAPTLIRTGLRVLISTLFGQFADRRIAVAAASEIAPDPFDPALDYRRDWEGKDFWFDYVADVGDGWNSTFAIARLLARDDLAFDGGQSLPRGQFVIMGGDQVYPVASLEAYHDRLLAPYDTAQRTQAGGYRWPKDKRPHLYAIPGNHDWYDGLSSFLSIFCRRRVKSTNGFGADSPGRYIGGRETRQRRSYFALKLPGNWWLWATDNQLEGYIDQPQLDYFRHVASAWMDPGSNVILCTGTPDWEYVDPERVAETFNQFSYIERFAGLAVDEEERPMKHRLRLALSGDSHHYARFTEDDRHYVTCGGGGAFLHPTHHLRDRSFDCEWPKPGVARPKQRDKTLFPRKLSLECRYPKASKSRLLAWGNLLFAARNPGYVLFLAIAYGLFLWLLEADARQGSLLVQLSGHAFWYAMETLWKLILSAPGTTLLFVLSLVGYIYFADAKSWMTRSLVGLIHGTVQAFASTASVAATLLLWPWSNMPVPALVAATFGAALVSATCFGAYLLIALNGFGRHWNEAFSSLAIRHHKSFLRFHIHPDGGIDVYPIGLDHVPADCDARRPALAPHLIEKPIKILREVQP
jgi:hypothetical protein